MKETASPKEISGLAPIPTSETSDLKFSAGRFELSSNNTQIPMDIDTDKQVVANVSESATQPSSTAARKSPTDISRAQSYVQSMDVQMEEHGEAIVS